MLSKSSKWELGFVHYIAKFTIMRSVISRFEGAQFFTSLPFFILCVWLNFICFSTTIYREALLRNIQLMCAIKFGRSSCFTQEYQHREVILEQKSYVFITKTMTKNQLDKGRELYHLRISSRDNVPINCYVR